MMGFFRNKILQTPNNRLAIIILVVVILLCNLAFVNSSGIIKFGWTIFGYTGLYLAFYYSNLKFKDLGLAKSSVKSGLKWGLISIGIIGLALICAFFISESIFKDSRYNLALTTVLYNIMLVVPFNTVVFEELVFRGFLPAFLLSRLSRNVALLLASALFGLWHVSTAGKIDVVNDVAVQMAFINLAVFLATAAAGCLLLILRWRSDSLLAPIMAHWFINAFAIFLAYIAW